MPSPRRVKKSVRVKKTKSARKTRKSPRKSVKKSPRKTKRSYRWGGETIKISESLSANDWRKDAFDEYRDYLFNILNDDKVMYDEYEPDTGYKYSKNGHVAYFTTDIDNNHLITFHPAKSATDDTIDRSRTIKIWADGDEGHNKAGKYWEENIKGNHSQPWKCVQPYSKQHADTKDRLRSCSESGSSMKGYEKRGGSNRQECIENCHM